MTFVNCKYFIITEKLTASLLRNIAKNNSVKVTLIECEPKQAESHTRGLHQENNNV